MNKLWRDKSGTSEQNVAYCTRGPTKLLYIVGGNVLDFHMSAGHPIAVK